MPRRRKPRTTSQELTTRYRAGGFNAASTDNDSDELESNSQRFSNRSKNATQNKILRTTELRAALQLAAEQADDSTVQTLPQGQVTQVYSLFSEVEHAGQLYRCVVRKTLNKVSDTQLVVGDRVRFRIVTTYTGPHVHMVADAAPDEGVIEQVLPRDTVLTRSDSFNSAVQHPIVANADQMLIVASLKFPNIKWGLIDRMIVAARSGKLVPILCLNKIDLHEESSIQNPPAPGGSAKSEDSLDYYTSLGIQILRTSAERSLGLDELRAVLTGRVTVLAGHSGVGKSSLIRAIQPQLDLRTAPVSNFNDKGRHTTTSARRYLLDFGGTVIDTPGVKMFGLWNVTRETLPEFFPDVQNDAAPEWRRESYARLAESLPS